MKVTEKTGRFQKKLEEKQAASLQSIKERESQVRTTFRVRAVLWHNKSKPRENQSLLPPSAHPLPGHEKVDEGPTHRPLKHQQLMPELLVSLLGSSVWE